MEMSVNTLLNESRNALSDTTSPPKRASSPAPPSHQDASKPPNHSSGAPVLSCPEPAPKSVVVAPRERVPAEQPASQESVPIAAPVSTNEDAAQSQKKRVSV